ncbi:PD-(D/E)XK nuclease family protein [Corallococcus praedator]|uniref:PD-(D/E)XK nuclease family protein n=1 Tax=Corallococcus praedator TaxID=2316724 RepID=A0ABX9QT49_9BACT|nr:MULTISPECIES: PD-(D/E)XK nuclease family protein [Corallococcus]RKH34947.1 PD-(D/E)XK nuclease family protein [Corallococcus sp. CA031C]RKI17149.1 PD-(D/E)XK nuclease family protein [Corallococcus praedator]
MSHSAEEVTRHAVESGVLRRLSVSQLRKFALCERAWFFAKVLRLPERPLKARDLGTAVHAQLEYYLRTGEDVLGALAAAGKHLLPAPGPDLLVEEHFGQPSPLFANGIPLTGYIDLVNPRRLAEGVLRVTDHKTTKSIASYAATPEQLTSAAHDAGIQMVGYGYWAVLAAERFPGLKRLELEHLYFQTHGARLARSVVATVSVEHVRDEWHTHVEPMARRMRDVARATSPSQVKPTWSACQKYGGCSFQAQCLNSQSQGSKPMALMDRILKPQTPPTPPAASAPAQAATELELAAVLPPDAPKSDPALASIPAPEQAALPASDEAPRRKRRTKAEMEAARTSDPSRPAEGSLSLFVDCVPNCPAEPLAGYVGRMVAKIEQECGVVDIRVAPNDSPLAYGKWKGVLAATIRAEPPEPGTYAALGVAGSELMQVAVEALEPLCGTGHFVRGVR